MSKSESYKFVYNKAFIEFYFETFTGFVENTKKAHVELRLIGIFRIS